MKILAFNRSKAFKNILGRSFSSRLLPYSEALFSSLLSRENRKLEVGNWKKCHGDVRSEFAFPPSHEKPLITDRGAGLRPLNRSDNVEWSFFDLVIDVGQINRHDVKV